MIPSSSSDRVNYYTDKVTAEDKVKLDDAVITFFRESRIDPRIADSQAFINMLKVLRPQYDPPSSEVIRAGLAECKV